MPVSSGKLFEILGNVSAGHYLRPCAWSFDTCSCGLTIVSFISPSSTSYEMCAQALSDQSIFAGSSSSDRHFLFVQRKKEVERGGGRLSTSVLLCLLCRSSYLSQGLEQPYLFYGSWKHLSSSLHWAPQAVWTNL